MGKCVVLNSSYRLCMECVRMGPDSVKDVCSIDRHESCVVELMSNPGVNGMNV